MRRVMFILAGVILCLLLVGCGGGTGSNQSAGTGKATGKATVTVQWPNRGRLIPEAANSIVVVINQGASQVGQQILARPASGGTSTATFNVLPVGNLSVTATSFPNADGTGTALSRATIPLTIQANQITNFSLTMSSTIAKLNLTVPTNQITAGGT